jgi:hypothetical protein
MVSGWRESAATFKKSTAEKLAFICLCGLDLTLTIVGMYLGFYEMNPLMRFLIHLPVLLVLVKLFLPIGLAWLLPGKLLWPSIALLALIVIWNVKELVVYLA